MFAAPRFVEVAADAGLDFEHVNGMAGELWLAEIMGAGVGVLDFDGDGRMDLWLVQGGPLRGEGERPCDRLYRNVTEAGRLRFVDVTETAGICADGYGMGIATGDIDNDGDLDVFVADFGPNRLFENLGNGGFRERAWDDASAWSVSASFADADGDGWLDLYVANYVDFTVATHKVCRDDLEAPSYCSPEVYAPSRDRFYRNLGDGGFQAAPMAIPDKLGAGLGVVAEDFNGDGRTDFYVANDMTDNLLWLNRGAGRFKDEALLAGVAVNGDGHVEASMGVDAEDFDGDCDVDLFMTHLAVQTNTLYQNDGKGWFMDRSNATGVAEASIPFTGFGGGWLDADNDGDLDIFSANGAVTAISGQDPGPLGLPLRQQNQLWLNDGGRYRHVAVPALAAEEVSRGTAFADLDNDGDLDIVVTNNRGAARLYRNDARGNHWLGIELRAPGLPVAGSVVQLETADGPCQRRRYGTDGSYASAHEPRLLFGLGADDVSRRLRVTWPDGSIERFGPLAVDRYHVLRRGPVSGAAPKPVGDEEEQ